MRDTRLLAVMFIDPDGGAAVTWRRAEIQADPEGYARFSDTEKARGARALALFGDVAEEPAR